MRPISFEALFGSLISGSTASAPASSSKPEKGGGRRKEGGRKGVREGVDFSIKSNNPNLKGGELTTTLIWY